MDDDPLESQEFYKLMRNYRHATIIDEGAVYEAFEAVRNYIRSQIINPLTNELNIAKEFIAEHVGVEPEMEQEPNEVN